MERCDEYSYTKHQNNNTDISFPQVKDQFKGTTVQNFSNTSFFLPYSYLSQVESKSF